MRENPAIIYKVSIETVSTADNIMSETNAGRVFSIIESVKKGNKTDNLGNIVF